VWSCRSPRHRSRRRFTIRAGPNDRLLLGMKGSISEFELGVFAVPRMLDAARSKARPRRTAAFRSLRLYLAPRSRARFGSRPASTGGDPAHLRPLSANLAAPGQVLLSMKADHIHFPRAVGRRPDDKLRMDADPLYRNVHRGSEEPILWPVCMCTGKARSVPRSSMAGRARAMATASRSAHGDVMIKRSS